MSTVTIRRSEPGFLTILVDDRVVLTSGLDDGCDLSEKPLSANSIVAATVKALAAGLGIEVRTDGPTP